MIIRFLSCEIMFESKLSLVIESTRLDIVDPDRLTYGVSILELKVCKDILDVNSILKLHSLLRSKGRS